MNRETLIKIIESDDLGILNIDKPKWMIWDAKDRCWVKGIYATEKRAIKKADNLDNEYGAYRFYVKIAPSIYI